MKTIIWDIDDTLNDFMYRWFKHFIQERNALFLGRNLIEYEDLVFNPPHEILNYTKDDYLMSIDNFADHHYGLLQPDQEILDWFNMYGYNFNHIVLTSCPMYRTHYSFEWVIYWFDKWIRSYNVIPSPREYDRIDYSQLNYETKADFIKKNFKQVDYFIDDNEKNCKEVELLGVKTYSINRPWNKSNWSTKEILEKLI